MAVEMKFPEGCPLEDIDKFIPNPRNARKHPPEQIAKLAGSILEFGFAAPILVNDNFEIVVGHGRLEGARKAGYTKAPYLKVSHLSPEQMRLYMIADNQLESYAEWDEEMLAMELEDLKALSQDIELTGFTEEDLAKMIDGDDQEDVEDDEYDLTEALTQASFVERGDIWTVGKHYLMCGDSTNPEDVDALMDGDVANLILTDPPYGVSYKGSSGLTIQNDSIEGEDFYRFLLASFQNMAEHLSKGCGAYIFHADTEGLNFRRAFQDAGFKLSGCCIWVKDSLVLGHSDYQWQHEPILYGYLPGGKGRHTWYGGRDKTTIWEFAKPKRNSDHPTSKPLDLLAYPIQNSTQENGIVMDLFGGSGSTLMACEETNRKCRTMELDEKYASVILRRYVAATGDSENVFVIRDGSRIDYDDIAKEVEV